MISAEVRGSKELATKFDGMTAAVHASLLKKIYSLTIQLATRVRRKLTGEVLQVRSGNLRASIHEDVKDTPTEIIGRVFSSGDVKYAGIHEYGGVVPAHVVVPNKARALAFVVGGKQVFAMRANIPDVKMPERSYMRSSLVEMKSDIIAGLTEAARQGAQR